MFAAPATHGQWLECALRRQRERTPVRAWNCLESQAPRLGCESQSHWDYRSLVLQTPSSRWVGLTSQRHRICSVDYGAHLPWLLVLP